MISFKTSHITDFFICNVLCYPTYRNSWRCGNWMTKTKRPKSKKWVHLFFVCIIPWCLQNFARKIFHVRKVMANPTKFIVYQVDNKNEFNINNNIEIDFKIEKLKITYNSVYLKKMYSLHSILYTNQDKIFIFLLQRSREINALCTWTGIFNTMNINKS